MEPERRVLPSREEDAANLKFVEIANPHMWLLAANNLHAQALHLDRSKGKSMLTHTDFREGTMTSWDGVNKSRFLLGGFALENAIKAFLVYENPQWISNGRLSSRLRSHSLVSLQKQSRRIPYRSRHIGVLREFENGLESWARYPCSLNIGTSVDEVIMRNEIWEGYICLMRAYGRRLMGLLRLGWNGPHGFYGKWTYTCEFLSTDTKG
jgi:hypothetical protein